MDKRLSRVLLVLIMACTQGNAQKESMRSKRLLLSDPDVMGSRLSNLEQTVQKLTQTVTLLQTELAQEKNNVSQLQIGLAQEKINVMQLKTESVQEKNNLVQLKLDLVQETNNVLQLKTELAQEKNNVLQLQNKVSQLQSDLANEQINVTLLQTVLSQEKANISKIAARVQNLGSTYVRWGRKQCSAMNTDLIYTGFASGQPYYYSSHYYSGPSNMLCLPNNPNVSNRTAPENSKLFGSEYESGDFFTKGAQDEDVPCALCRSKDTVSSVMIPGRNTCHSGWKMEYQGILASGDLDTRPSSYICVDSNPEFLQAGERNNNENILYPTRTQCGSLPCPPYVNNMVVNCVVCSK